MARKDIGVGLNRDNRNAINHNFIELYGSVSNIANTITDEVYSQIIDGSKLNWLTPVDSYEKLPKDAKKGDTVMTREDGMVYRFDGEQWIDIQQIDAGPVNELDSRLSQRLDSATSQLAEKADKDVTQLALIALDAKIDNRPPPETIHIENLWDRENTVLGTLNETSGNVSNHATNLTLNFVKIVGGEPYVFMTGSVFSSKIVFYDGIGGAVVEGHGWFSSNQTPVIFTAPENATHVRITVDYRNADSTIFNIGTEIWTPDDDGSIYDGGFWDGIPTPPLRDNSVKTKHIEDKSITESKISQELMNLIRGSSQFTNRPASPFPKKLNFEIVRQDWDEVNHLSQDGEVLYFKRGAAIYQTLDDLETPLVRVGVPSPDGMTIQAIRELPDGQLIVSTTRNTNADIRSKVYKSLNYDRYNPENTEFYEVLSAISSEANIYQPWGLEVHDNIVLASEYGLRGDNGARHVYLSTDYGDNWTVIFDQKTTTQEIEGAPEWTTSAHLHTVHYDRYWGRIWLVVGDNPNSATYYSDNMGAEGSWKFVGNSLDMQYTGIVSYPEGVVFGSDRGPNGLYAWHRTENKNDEVVIEPLMIINNDPTITHIFQRPFRRYAEKGELTLFPATRASSSTLDQGSVIIGFTGIDNPYLLYELENLTHSGFVECVGVTARGNIFTSYHNGTNHSVLKAKAPLWE